MRLTLFTIILTGLFIPAFSQVSVYVSGGYGLPSGGSVLGTTTDFQSSNSYVEEASFGSLGAGLQGQVGARFMFTEGIGFDGQIGFTRSNQLVSFYEDGDDLQTSELSNTQLTFVPSLIVQSSTGNLTVYGRFGIVVPFVTNIKEVLNLTDKDVFDFSTGEREDRLETIEADWRTSLGFGFQGGLGVMIPVSSFEIFAEANVQTLSLFAASRTIVFYEDDGDDQLREIPTSTKEVIYMKEITEDSNRRFNSNFDSDDPSEEVAPSFAFNNLGLRIGINFPLGE